MAQRASVCQLLWFGRITLLCFYVSGQLFLQNGLTAAVALPKPIFLVAFCQQVLRQAGDLHHLLAVGAPRQHKTMLPVMQVQALLRE